MRFDPAITVGLELSGAAWGREKDRLGIAGGWLRASSAFEAPRGAERLAELYYAWQVNEHLEVTPDLQWIARPGADGTAEDITVVGLRAR